jgi:ankyrin repeat protein
MPERKGGKLKCRLRLRFLLTLLLLAGCGRPRGVDYVVLSYSEHSSFCLGCPSFRVELRPGGHVNLFGLSGCAIPGEYHFRVPEAAFSSLLREFEKARFFSTSRLDPRYGGEDALVKRLGYRDESRIHEVVDAGRPLPAIAQLEKDFRNTTNIEKYLTPSVALYQELVKSGWNVNTLGEDHDNALVAAVAASDSASVAFLLRHGATISHTALEFAVHAKTIDILRLLAAAKKIDYRSAEGGSLLLAAVGAGSTQLIRELIDRGAPVNYRQPQSEDTALLLVAGNTEQTDKARMLIERGADVNARNWMGQTALFRAATGPNTGMLELLAAHGADPNIRDKQGRTALEVASSLCLYWNIKALLAHGADPLIRNDRGRTALEPDYIAPNDPKCSICRQLLKEASNRAQLADTARR